MIAARGRIIIKRSKVRRARRIDIAILEATIRIRQAARQAVIGRPFAITEAQVTIIGVVDRRYEITAVIIEVTAHNALDDDIGRIAFARDTRADIEVIALIIIAQDEVDHTGHRVGTVERGSTTGQNLDALNKLGRDGTDIDGLRALKAGNVTAAIDEGQCPVTTHTAQVEGVGTGRTVAICIDGTGGDEGRNVIDDIGKIDLTRILQLLLTERLHRNRHDEVGVTRDARTGDDNGLCRLIILGKSGRCHDGTRQDQCCCTGRKQKIITHSIPPATFMTKLLFAPLRMGTP